jgi:phosphonoacetaldehyde hydrolase
MTDAQQQQIGLVVFDWAGTMVDHGSRAPAAVFVQAFAEHGVSITTAQARGPMGMAKRDHIRTIADEPGVAAAWQAGHGRPFSDSDIDAIYASFLPLQMACLKDHCGVIPGVVEAVNALRARGIRIGSSTGYTAELMDIVMPEAQKQGLKVDAMRCATSVAVGRPAPWLIYENAQQLGVYPMARVVKVDDTVTGVEAGRNAGCWTVGVSRTGNLLGLSERELAELPDDDRRGRIERATQELLSAGAHAVVESAADLLPVIDAFDAMLAEGRLPVRCGAGAAHPVGAPG